MIPNIIAKRKLFSLPSKIFLDEDLTKTQVVELKHSSESVTTTHQVGKWVVIRNLKTIIRDSPLVVGKRNRPPRPNDGPTSSRTRGRPPLAPFLLTAGMVMALYIHYLVFCVMLWGLWIYLSLLRLTSPVRPLLWFIGYQWLFVCREEVRASGGVCNSGGVACLIKDIFRDTSIVHSYICQIYVGPH